MKNQDIIILAVGAAVVWWLWNKYGKTSQSNTIINTGKPDQNGISEIFSGAQRGDIGYGWRYFTDGTAISPDGTYYHNGQAIWSPAK